MKLQAATFVTHRNTHFHSKSSIHNRANKFTTYVKPSRSILANDKLISIAMMLVIVVVGLELLKFSFGMVVQGYVTSQEQLSNQTKKIAPISSPLAAAEDSNRAS